jgi:hypothetical protein
LIRRDNVCIVILGAAIPDFRGESAADLIAMGAVGIVIGSVLVFGGITWLRDPTAQRLPRLRRLAGPQWWYRRPVTGVIVGSLFLLDGLTLVGFGVDMARHSVS